MVILTFEIFLQITSLLVIDLQQTTHQAGVTPLCCSLAHPPLYNQDTSFRRRKEGNVLFNNTLIFLIWLYGTGLMIKDHSSNGESKPAATTTWTTLYD